MWTVWPRLLGATWPQHLENAEYLRDPNKETQIPPESWWSQLDILWLVCWSFIRSLDNITWHHITPVTIIQTKKNEKEGETDSSTERILNFYVRREPVFLYLP